MKLFLRIITRAPARWLLLAQLVFLPILANSTKSCEGSDHWSCHASTYVGGGYVFSHQYLTRAQYPGLPGGLTAKNVQPANLNGFRVGFGTTAPDNRQLLIRFSYAQFVPQTLNYNGFSFTSAKKGVLGEVGWNLNPDDRFRINLLSGGSVIATNLTAHSNQTSLSLNSVDVDPMIGFDSIFQINRHAAIKFGALWIFPTHSKLCNGSIAPFVSFNYFL